jgi:hypothetical protein
MEHERLSWFDRCRSYRDQLIASPRVQRWVLATPLTRPITRRRARAMLDLCAGFVYSQVLFACVRLRLFDILFKQPLTIAALAERLSLSAEVTCRLLDAAVLLGLAERRGRSLYGLGQLGAALAGNRVALSLIEHQPLLYADLQDPVDCLYGGPVHHRLRRLASWTVGSSFPHPWRTRLALSVRYGRLLPSVDASTCELREGGKQTRGNAREVRIGELVGRVAATFK